VLIIIILLFIIALPTIANILGAVLGLWVIVDFIVKYKYLILLGAAAIGGIYAFDLHNKANSEPRKWNTFQSKTMIIVRDAIDREFAANPLVTPRHIFDEVVKEWVPLAKKFYPDIKPRELGERLDVTPSGIQQRMIKTGYLKDS